MTTDTFQFADVEPQKIIAILVGLVDSRGAEAIFGDGSVRFINDTVVIHTETGAISITSVDGGYEVGVYGEPWAELSLAIVPFMEQQGVVGDLRDNVINIIEYDPNFTGGLQVATGDVEGDAALEGGGLWNFEDLSGSESIYYIGEAADGHDWFTATDDLWL